METHPWHAFSHEETAARLATNLSTGLTKTEAADRLKLGRNKLPAPNRDSFITRFLRQFASPIAVVLLFAAGATMVLSHYTDALVIFIALFVNVVMGLIQEGRAGKAFEALQKSEAKWAVAVRDGEPKKISAEELVVGDVVVLSTGSSVPADIRIIEAHSLVVNEAALTGEWVPVDKTADESGEGVPLAERRGMVYSGTLIAGGTGRGIVVAVGAATELGRIASELGSRTRVMTPLMKDIHSIARLLVAVSLLVLLLVVLMGYLRGLPGDEILFIAIALAVSSVPEGLPAAVTVVLALGMERILKAGGLVRNLLAAETLGTTSIILTDKTGTLTKGNIQAAGYATLCGTTEDADGALAHQMLRAAVLASDGYIEEVVEETPGEEKIIAHGRPVEQAILMAALRSGLDERSLRKDYPRLDILPFASERRYGGMLVSEEGKRVVYMMGAPEVLMAQATHARGVSGTEKLNTEYLAHFTEALARSTREGKRVLAVGRLETSSEAFPKNADEHEEFLKGIELIGFIIFSDEIREEAKSAVREMQEAGARVIMLTGDNPETALYIAREVGIAEEGETAYTGAELAQMTDDELLDVLAHHHVFARVAPTDKLRIARALTAAGEVVAMTGDGVNDAPALEAASIGVAVGSGTDVAKEASDLVLLGDSFSVITAAIREGRRLRDNFKKIFAYMLSTNFSEVVLITFALLLGLPLPLLPTQILWSNLVEGGLMNFAFAFEPLYPSVMKRNPRDADIRTVLSKKVLGLIAMVGVITAGLLSLTYLYFLNEGLPELELQTLMFIGISISTMFTAVSMKSFGTPIWKLNILSNKFLLISMLSSVVLLSAALYYPPVQAIVKTVTPEPWHLLFFLGVGLVNLATVELAKWAIFIWPESHRKARAAVTV